VINLDVLVDNGTIAPQDRDLLQFVDTPEEAFELLKEGLTHNHLVPEAERQTKAGVEDEEQLLRPEIARTR
jgi:predicted Rossmann-fold nucleotide-binding protein